ncbi:hypothetical protein D3C84_547400 [compost metagenome]
MGGKDHPLFQLFESRRCVRIGQRTRHRSAPLPIEQHRFIVLMVFRILDHFGQFLMAQNFNSSPANSPDT